MLFCICFSLFCIQIEIQGARIVCAYVLLLLVFAEISEVEIQWTFQKYQKSSSEPIVAPSYVSDRVQELLNNSVNIIVNPRIMITVENMTMICCIYPPSIMFKLFSMS